MTVNQTTAIEKIAAQILAATADKQPLRIRGGGSKDFYGGAVMGELLDTSQYKGIVSYEPTELVITARAGTPLTEIESLLREQKQMLAFEPPHFSSVATLGGCVAAGLSGPRRPYAGAVRDLILGVRMLDGNASDLRFGGEVMKNVAGYDVSRLMVGALGTLGVLLEVSLKVLPLPAVEQTLGFEMSQADAIATLNQWAVKPLPLSASCHYGNLLTVRLSGSDSAVHSARQKLGGEEIADSAAFWLSVREQTLPFFGGDESLWRLSIKASAASVDLSGEQLIEWNGALRWLKTTASSAQVREAATQAGGHATLFRSNDKSGGVFHPLPPALLRIHQRLKQTFDPAGIFNRGRLYGDF